MGNNKTIAEVSPDRMGSHGWVVSILGEWIYKAGSKDEALARAEKINTRGSSMTDDEILAYYKLGEYSANRHV